LFVVLLVKLLYVGEMVALFPNSGISNSAVVLVAPVPPLERFNSVRHGC